MRIIQVFNRYLLPGGEEKSVLRIAEDLEAAGHQLARFWRESAEWQQPDAPPRWKQPFLMWRNPRVLRELHDLHESFQPDLWLMHNVVPVVSLGVYRLALRLRVPVVQWLHNYRPISPSGTLFAGGEQLEPEDRLIYGRETLAGSWNGRLLTGLLSLGYWRLKQRGDFDSVQAWVAVSEEMRHIFERAGWFPDKLHAIPHSWHIETSKVSTLDSGHFLFLGRMVETKGVRFLIKLWSNPALRDARLIMAGSGPLADELRGRTPANVRWVGHVDGEEKKALLASCRAIVFPSAWPEPLSTIAYEGYETGKPILASNLGGMKEIVFDRKTGRLLPPQDEGAWLTAIQELDETTAREWGLEGRRWLNENVSPVAWNRRFDESLRRIVARDRDDRGQV